jgi:hypothetical protein
MTCGFMNRKTLSSQQSSFQHFWTRRLVSLMPEFKENNNLWTCCLYGYIAISPMSLVEWLRTSVLHFIQIYGFNVSVSMYLWSLKDYCVTPYATKIILCFWTSRGRGERRNLLLIDLSPFISFFGAVHFVWPFSAIHQSMPFYMKFKFFPAA